MSVITTIPSMIESSTNQHIKYGLLYNWYTVDDARGITPSGWHVPTKAEWETLSTYLGGWQLAGGKMKKTGDSRWLSPNVGATNSTGFTALPGGHRLRVLTYPYISTYDLNGVRCCLLASDERVGGFSNMFYLENASTAIWYFDANMAKQNGYSVRLIRDSNDGWSAGDRITDYDGNVYDTIMIGTQIFTVQNLAVVHYNNGDSIPEVTDGYDWGQLTSGALCAYNNDWSYAFH